MLNENERIFESSHTYKQVLVLVEVAGQARFFVNNRRENG